ncbi:MAG TPA: hypothetical protein VGG74_03810 [Kofleriaceae bacterium]|jgi:hypothetical protein
MPSPSTSKWPKPRSEDEFEQISVDFLRIRWNDRHAALNGRRGQRQGGVDILGKPSWLNGKTAGAQCKNTNALKLKMFTGDIENAKAFPGGLGEFLVLTSGDRDARLQAELRLYSRNDGLPFRAEIVFWDDIIADLAADEALIAKHWKGFPRPAKKLGDVETLRLMAAAFDRPAFTTPFHGESSLADFKAALTDTIMALNTGVQKTRDGVALGRIPSRHELKSAAAMKRLKQTESALVSLRSKFDELVRAKEIRPCGCDKPECSMHEMTASAIREMDVRRQEVLDLFRRVHPEFDVHVGR